MEELVGGNVSLQQRGGRADDPKVIEDEGARWAKHEIASLRQFHFYAHLKGSDRPRHVKAPYFLDPPFRQLWEGSAPVPQEESPEEEAPTEEEGRLDFTGLTRLAERGGRLLARVPALDQAANAWVGWVEDACTRITMPGLQMQLASAAEQLEARMRGIEISHRGQGINVAGLNGIRPLMAGVEPPKREFSVLAENGSVSQIEVAGWPQSRFHSEAPHTSKSYAAAAENGGLEDDDEAFPASATPQSASGGRARPQRAHNSGFQDRGPSSLVGLERQICGNENEAKPTSGHEDASAADEGRQGDEVGADEGAGKAPAEGDEAGLEGDDEGAGQEHGALGGDYFDRRMKAAQEAIASGADLEEFCRQWRAEATKGKNQADWRDEMEARVAARERELEERERASAATKPRPRRWDPDHASIGIDVEVVEPDPDRFPPVPATDPRLATEPRRAGTPGGDGATPQPPSERPNGLRGRCAVCGKVVPAKGGLMSRRVDRWVVRHPYCQLRA
jgi:hypothetical protein